MYKHHELINYYTIRTLIYFLSKSAYIILFLKKLTILNHLKIMKEIHKKLFSLINHISKKYFIYS